MELIVFNAVLLLIVIFLLFLLSMVWPPDSPWSPWWRTNKEISKAVIKLADISSKDIVYELGSGDGEFLLTVAGKTNAKCIGIEIDPLRYWISKLRIKFAGLEDKIAIVRKDFFKVNISDATVVYMYLVPIALKKLKPKFEKELKKGARIVSLKYETDLLMMEKDKKNNLNLYKIL